MVGEQYLSLCTGIYIRIQGKTDKKVAISLRLCVSSLHRDHANLLCIFSCLFNARSEDRATLSPKSIIHILQHLLNGSHVQFPSQSHNADFSSYYPRSTPTHKIISPYSQYETQENHTVCTYVGSDYLDFGVWFSNIRRKTNHRFSTGF